MAHYMVELGSWHSAKPRLPAHWILYTCMSLVAIEREDSLWVKIEMISKQEACMAAWMLGGEKGPIVVTQMSTEIDLDKRDDI